MTKKENKFISIVIPCRNEEGNMVENIRGISKVLTEAQYRHEIICIDDGSKDKTWEKIQELSKKYTELKGIRFMRNHGMTQAYSAGFDSSKGDYVITMSADMEIPAKNLLKVIELLDEGYDFVNTNREGRWGNADRALPSKIANNIIGKISGVYMKDTGSGMKGFRRVLIDNFSLYGEMHRMIPAYLSSFGAKMTEFDVEFKDRTYGTSSYGGLSRTFKVLLDIITMAFMINLTKKPFMAIPGRLFGATGALISGMGGLIAFYLLILKLMGQSIGGRPLFFVSIFMIVIGLQSLMIGMIGELLMRTYFEASGRKTYTIREKINIA
ncbi:glycosyltransferase family 2 protein [Candidatus Nomurabacteria bacterium]|mgnify:CR=1 FL=1|uniref:Glycosyltransferase family 2 protein n=1 Tax=candidate division WWE3 bacterium TaxID=2053526 RepID=A0A955IVV4_UNCKA|nr:glycosyltransferase family 2 protein [candidate division WWE3 bacterium]MCB9823367.1 glycosyltransferase family 2 protein [Candidatus Nomurabacteria bacterium]MCB9826740.1 glycosyltransferase family 2 protein [Candidatus Nomurabacteria bacterium]MCB9827649.1 glycosyltransferase family 2 protein [Candidatus Nomurabacteria bacterium]HXK52695.1 glycosyltransferase family 2 protein [bacterium]